MSAVDELWVTRLRKAAISEPIIHRIYEVYGDSLPENVISALENDDMMCGLNSLGLDLGHRLSCTNHDIKMHLSKLKYPIWTAWEIQAGFAEDCLKEGVQGLWVAASAIPYMIGGVLGGGSIMFVRWLQNHI